MGHPSWDCSRTNLLNFEVPTKFEATDPFPWAMWDIKIHIP
ncbi:hypothetical protein DVH24_000961 [Malus domestica]|uniref:Uncharacterized protein n=1 Tax=Malus domestica TaxID=3750 RepID=A0A498K038_MALDO|nr:hypothetical protein DVH24_000961 [Malus domestica]